MVDESTKDFTCFPSKNPEELDVKELRRPVEWACASYQLFTEIQVQVLFDNAEKMRCCSITHEQYMLALMKGHMFQDICQIDHHCTLESVMQDIWSYVFFT
jgi:hypothetical protein